MSEQRLARVLSVTDVALFNVVVIFSLRGMATAAKMGPVAILLWLIGVAAFFVPLALTVTELSSRDPGQGGFYRWVRAAFGDAPAFLTAWVYWVSNITYLPSLLVFIAGNVVYVIGRPALGDNPWFVVSLALGLLWFSAWLNIRGLTLGRLVTNFGAMLAFAAAVLLIAAGAVALARYGSATNFGGALRLPAGTGTLGYIGTLSFALVGIELATLMGDEIKDPRRTIPRAIILAAVVICALYVLGTVAILIAVPAELVSPISGGLGAVQAVADRAGWPLLPKVVAAAVTFSALAGFIAWLGGVARLPYAVGLDRFLPPVMAELHPRYGTPHKAILLQSAITSLFIVASQAGATVAEAYVLLLLMTVILNFVPFLFIFSALPMLRPATDEPGVVRAPGGRAALWIIAGLGIATTLITLASAVIPTPDVTNPLWYEAKMWGGMLLFMGVGLALFRRYRHGAAAA